MSANAIRKGIAEGAANGAFGYTAGSVPSLGPDGKYQVIINKIRFGPPQASDDEIDLETGFLMMPQAIPEPAPQPGEPLPVPGGSGGGPGTGPIPPEPTPQELPLGSKEKIVELTFTADRNQLFTAWNAVANLADLAGSVTVTVKAESEKGFDQSKLRNGVLEPLEEADLIEDKK